LNIPSRYQTLEKLSEGLYKEKGSKFIAYAVPCFNEEEAKVYLAEWRKLHHQARHVCYAYRFGSDLSVYRANDDGEPNNSAGAPILGQIQSFGLTNVLIGVVRYFGGTKLGVGGLIHAYKTAAKDAIENGSIVERELKQLLELNFSYGEMPQVMNAVKQFEVDILSTDLQLDCKINVDVSLELCSLFKKKIEEIEGLEIIEKEIR
jgi:uncharacterized YigZ family protein